MNVLKMINMHDFFQNFVVLRSTEILIVSDFLMEPEHCEYLE